MINDIVTRLRRQAIEEGFSATDWTELSFDVQNLCDEIELLRDALIECESTISRLQFELKYSR